MVSRRNRDCDRRKTLPPGTASLRSVVPSDPILRIDSRYEPEISGGRVLDDRVGPAKVPEPNGIGTQLTATADESPHTVVVDGRTVVEAAPPRASGRSRIVPLPPDIITTKLNIPQPRPNLVNRPRLLARLGAGLAHRLTLVCAPAGFGKTMLLSEWVQHLVTAAPTLTVVWFSLDEGDNDPGRFIRHIAAAFRHLTPRASETIRIALQSSSSSPPSPQAVMGMLINNLAQCPSDSVLVFDDYHVLRNRALSEAVGFLIDRMPSRFHLVLSTREDPALPLARLRARNEMVELRQADLRFTTAEAAAFLEQALGRALSAADVQSLQARTEGWIAGLQLAALSMQDRADASAFIAALRSSHCYVLDYLAEEVLGRQSGDVQDFLLRTSILDRFCVPLCEAMMGGPRDASENEKGRHHVQDILRYLERANLFLVPLDADGHWYRYHSLFADLLRVRLRQVQPALLPELHRRASAWHDQAGLPVEAIDHALAAGDVEFAARLIEQHAHLLMAIRRESGLALGWLDALPVEFVRARPSLACLRALGLALSNDLEGAQAHIQEIEEALRGGRLAKQRRTIQGQVEAIRGSIARYVGDSEGAIAHCQKALTLLPQTERLTRPGVLFIAATQFLTSGDVRPAAERMMAELVRRTPDLGLPGYGPKGMALLARLQVMQGRLRQAGATYARVARSVRALGGAHALIGVLGYHFGLGPLLLERDELDAAEQLLAHGLDALTDTAALLDASVLLGHAAMAGVRQARGDGPGALKVMETFLRLAHQQQFTPAVLAQAAAVAARLHLRQGNLAEADRWAADAGLRVDDEPRFPQEAEYLTLVRVRIAQGRGAETLPLLDRMLKMAEAGGRGGSVIEILVLRALARPAQGQGTAALADVARALALGEPEGYVRVFVDEGQPMAALLQRAAPRGTASHYATRLVAAIRACSPEAPGGRGDAPRPAVALAEPLTAREQEVLRLLAADASNAEIAQKLFLTVGTVKTHVHNILGKFGVRTREQASLKASEFGLL